MDTLPILLELGLLVFCLIDAIQTPEHQVRNLPRWAWILLIVFFPIVGGVAWLVAGRPTRPSAPVTASAPGLPEPVRRPSSTRDIDERLDADLARVDREHEESLRKWEAELREREDRLRNDGEAAPPA